jgi:predicted RNA binding protein YcfA (HicA-like mRNA interferase family)
LEKIVGKSFIKGYRLDNLNLGAILIKNRYCPLKELRENKSMKVRDVIKLIKDDGWYLVSTRGSHRQFKHPVKSGRVTISGKLGDEVAIGTLGSIYKQARLK